MQLVRAIHILIIPRDSENDNKHKYSGVQNIEKKQQQQYQVIFNS